MRRDAKEIPEYLMRLMEPKGFHTAKDLAEATGIHISRIYYGINHRRFSERTAEALSELLECPPEQLGEVIYEKPPTQSDQLCWTCRNAVPDLKGHGCSWSRKLVPVKGWTAEKSTSRGKDTWSVKKCPEYVEERVSK